MRTTGEEKLGVNGLALHENGQDEAFPLSTRGPDLQNERNGSPFIAQMQEFLARFVCNALALLEKLTSQPTSIPVALCVWCQVKIEGFCACSSSHALISDH